METTVDIRTPMVRQDPKPPKPVPGPVLIGDILNAPLGQPDLVRLWIKDWDRLNKNRSD
jgi:hypothetical protein